MALAIDIPRHLVKLLRNSREVFPLIGAGRINAIDGIRRIFVRHALFNQYTTHQLIVWFRDPAATRPRCPHCGSGSFVERTIRLKYTSRRCSVLACESCGAILALLRGPDVRSRNIVGRRKEWRSNGWKPSLKWPYPCRGLGTLVRAENQLIEGRASAV